MTDELLAYLLDDLCPERRAEVERRLAEEPAWRRELARLEACLASGDPAACLDEPPGDLITRTCGLVERVGESGLLDQRRPVVSRLSPCEPILSSGSRWSLADCTVCAGVIGVLAMLMLPALRESRDAARRRVCADNLRALGTAIIGYTEKQGHALPPARPGDPVGMYAVELVERGGIDRVELARAVTCPDSAAADVRFAGGAAPYIPTRQELRAAKGSHWVLLVRAMSGSVAIRVGYFTGDHHRYHHADFEGRRGRPLASDAPVVSVGGVRSVVHGGRYNVMNEDLCGKFRTNCYLPPGLDHIFKNAAGAVAAGDDPKDVVLIGGDRRPDGKVVSLDEGQ